MEVYFENQKFLFATIILASTACVLNAQSTRTQDQLLNAATRLWPRKTTNRLSKSTARFPLRDGESYARAIYNIGVCHYELWQTEEAIVFYKRAIELKHGNYPRASYALGVALEDQGRPSRSEASLSAGDA